MGRGKFLSRKNEPPKPQSPEELEKSKNPLIQLGLAFKKLQKLAPETLPSTAGIEENVTKRPLVDINDVRKFLREKLAITKVVSTIPIPNPGLSSYRATRLHSPEADAFSETTHGSSQHFYSSDESSLPTNDVKSGARAFDIGTVGLPILEVYEPGRVMSSKPPSATNLEMRKPASRDSASVGMEQSTSIRLEVSEPSSAGAKQQSPTSLGVSESSRASSSAGMEQPSTIILEVDRAPSPAETEQPTTTYTWIVEPPSSNVTGTRLDMKDVQEFVRGVVEVVKRLENWGMPQTSWENKMPWHSPPPKILARGLQRPPESFASEEERLAFNRNARKRKKFLTGCPPTWSFMVANLAFIGFLVYSPLS